MANIMGIGVLSLNKIEKNILPKRLNAKVVFSTSLYFKIPPSHLFKALERF